MNDVSREVAAPSPELDTPDRHRLAVLTIGTLGIAVGVVLVISSALPVIPAWGLPTVLLVLTVAFLVLGRRAAVRGASFAARAWAGWAGLTVAFAVFGGGNLLGFGGALTATLLVVLAANAAIALWFRSGVHFAVVQALGFGWGVLAHVYGIPPWASVVLALAGLWWLGAVRVTRSVAVVTTLTIPLSIALLLHPLTHVGAAIDGADITLVAGLTALAVLIPGVVTRNTAPAELWPIVRRTALVVTVAQIAAGAVPAVGDLLTPDHPWPGVFAGIATVLAAVAVRGARPTRSGALSVLLACGGLVLVILVDVLAGQRTASIVSCAVLAGFLVPVLLRSRSTLARAGAWIGVIALAAFGVLVTGAPLLVAAIVLLAVGVVVVAANATGRSAS
ncbi:hypothetical protein [Curtobacterium sp. Leaf261]|uniref:hypothetical protein n=1 Tax=Curtobacterium sp. Leaf261 TaxID=1736311 RepID=UPI0006FD4C0E|nr:hypothetical protein [Curtobacterium sp. Leaf261]KQO61398.1 hypothetical protein ASF23_13055 [Curtobacterium sp. Leaf261]